MLQRQREHRLGHANEVGRLLGGDGKRQCVRIGQPDILPGEDDQTAGDEHQVFARLEHARQPVHGRVGI